MSDEIMFKVPHRISADKVVYLHIITWRGRVVGASHYYGELWQRGSVWDTPHHHVTRTLSASQAAELTREQYIRYNEGDETEVFTNEFALIRAARDLFEREYPKATVLVKGLTMVAEPQPVLIGPDWYMKLTNALVEINEALYYAKGKKAVGVKNKLLDAWYALHTEWDEEQGGGSNEVTERIQENRTDNQLKEPRTRKRTPNS